MKWLLYKYWKKIKWDEEERGKKNKNIYLHGNGTKCNNMGHMSMDEMNKVISFCDMILTQDGDCCLEIVNNILIAMKTYDLLHRSLYFVCNLFCGWHTNYIWKLFGINNIEWLLMHLKSKSWHCWILIWRELPFEDWSPCLKMDMLISWDKNVHWLTISANNVYVWQISFDIQLLI